MRRRSSPNWEQRRGYRCAEPKPERSIRKRLGNSGEPLIDGRDLVLQGFDLSSAGGIQDTYRRSAAGALNDGELVGSRQPALSARAQNRVRRI